MLFRALVTTSIEGMLNTLLYRSSALKTARQRLNGKILRINLEKFSKLLVLLFSNSLLSVLDEWEGEVDCSVIIRTYSLSNICDYLQLTTLIHSRKLVIEGDFKVAQSFIALVDLAEFDLTELLSPYIGDITAEVIRKLFSGTLLFFFNRIQRQQRYIADIITEEWRIAPGKLEIQSFTDQITLTNLDVEKYEKLLEKLEGK